MSRDLSNYIAEHKSEIEAALWENLPLSRQRFARRLNEALQYAVFPGGKRWRPFLTLLAGSLGGATEKSLLPAACAMEYLHTSSMILDDLPCMDDADLRRGRLALHMAFDESTALLTALTLLNQSYALLVQTCVAAGQAENAGALITLAADCIGADGMIGGQMVDLELGGTCLSQADLMSRNLKTTALMQLMMTVGARAQGATASVLQALAQYGEALGAAYQICDDLLDESGTPESLGKPLRQDERHLRPTFISEYGRQGAQRMAGEMVAAGIACLRKEFGNSYEVSLLAEAAMMIADSKPLITSTCTREVASLR
ncbi:MAG: polyprenyl synthetase family protein [Blastocatellia bacterium]